MATWSGFTASEVADEFSGSERTAYDAATGTNPLPNICGRVLERVRGAVESGGNTLGDEGTIPDSLKGEAVAIARWQYLLALPQNDRVQTDARKAAHDDAQARLDKISLGDITLGAPDDVDDSDNNQPGAWGGQEKLLMRTNLATDDN